MVSLMSLWLPVLLSAVGVFVVSSIIHTVLTYHQNDYAQVPQEDQVMAALRPFNLPPGQYVMPKPADAKAMRDPAFIARQQQGPNMFLNVFPNGPWAMGAQLTQWFVYCVVVSFVTAYVASRTLGAGTDYLQVFRVTGTVAFLAYGFAHIQCSSWFRLKWSTTFKSVFDALVYGLVTAGMFGWLWP